MRLAIVATSADGRAGGPGTRDGEVLRARLAERDAGFRIVDLDPAVDLAEQIDLLFDRGGADPEAPLLFYASADVVVSVDGELFLCLDPEQPDTGDSIKDLATLLRERSQGPIALVLECRHAPDPEDAFRSATVAGAAKSSVDPAGLGVELLVAAGPARASGGSPLTRALVEALDRADDGHGLTLARFFEEARESPEIAGAVPSFLHAKGPFDLELLPVTAPAPATEATPVFAPAPEEDDAAITRELPAARVEASIDGLIDHPSRTPTVVEGKRPYRAELDGAPSSARAPVTKAAEGGLDATIVSATSALVSPGAAAIPPAPAVPAALPIPARAATPAAGSAPLAPPTEDDLEDAEPISADPVPAAEDSTPGLPLLEERAFFRPDLSMIPATILGDKGPTRLHRSAPPPPPAAGNRASAPPSSVRTPPGGSPPLTPVPASVAPAVPAASDGAASRASAPPRSVSSPPPAPGPGAAAAEHMEVGNVLAEQDDPEGALASYKRALALLTGAQTAERAEVYVRMGMVKRQQDKRREAIASLEKGLSLAPGHKKALETLHELNLAESDHRAAAAIEEKLLALLTDPKEKLARLVSFSNRWLNEQKDRARAKTGFERARDLSPDDLGVLGHLRAIYEADGAGPEAIAVRLRVAELTSDPRLKATAYLELGQHHLRELKKEDQGLELLDKALEADPTMLEPLAVIAQILADRQEWSVLEQAYRKMIRRVANLPLGDIRTEVTWELCRQLGVLFLEHLEDPGAALDSYEDALREKPFDLETLLTAARVAEKVSRYDRVAAHLQVAARVEPGRIDTYHDLFVAFQRLRRPDQAFSAASVTTLLQHAESRERFIYEEHKPDGVPKFTFALDPKGWDFLRPLDRDAYVEAIFAAVAPAGVAARIAALADEGRLPELDPATRQDPSTSTISIVRSFAWASRLLAVNAPHIHLHDDDAIALAAVIAEEPAVIAGSQVLRGRTLPELAFVVGRHLAYHVGGNRLLLYYPSIEELSACFLAAIRLILPEVPVPANVKAQVTALERRLDAAITDEQRTTLAAAVSAFEAQESRASIGAWVASVERTATRAGFLLAGDLSVAVEMLRSEPRGVLDGEAKIGDLLSFAVSDEHHGLREAMGIAIEP